MNEQVIEKATETVVEATQAAGTVSEPKQGFKKNGLAMLVGFGAGVAVIAGAKPVFKGIKWIGSKIVRKKPKVEPEQQDDFAQDEEAEQ